jgi:hypothetical protein
MVVYRVFVCDVYGKQFISDHAEDQTQCNLFKQRDISLTTPQLFEPNAKPCG